MNIKHLTLGTSIVIIIIILLATPITTEAEETEPFWQTGYSEDTQMVHFSGCFYWAKCCFDSGSFILCDCHASDAICCIVPRTCSEKMTRNSTISLEL